MNATRNIALIYVPLTTVAKRITVPGTKIPFMRSRNAYFMADLIAKAVLHSASVAFWGIGR